MIESHGEHAAIAAVRDAELEIGTVCPRDQMRLPMMMACKGQCRRVRIAIAGKYPPHDAMRLDETHPIALECELRGPCSLLSAQDPQQVSRCVMLVGELGGPPVHFADRSRRKNSRRMPHISDLASGVCMSADACKSSTISLARAAAAGEK